MNKVCYVQVIKYYAVLKLRALPDDLDGVLESITEYEN